MELKSLRHREGLLEYYLCTSTLSDQLSRKYLPSTLKDIQAEINDVAMEVAGMRDERVTIEDSVDKSGNITGSKIVEFAPLPKEATPNPPQ